MSNTIIFDEANHTYTLNGKQLISVTQLLRKHGLSTDYSMVDDDVLNAKAERGTLIHKEIENYIKTGAEGFTDELDGYKALMSVLNLTPLASEKKVYNDIVAGTVDLIAASQDGIVIVDYKTCARLDKRTIAWQLSIYAYLARPIASEVVKLYCFHLLPQKSKVVEIDRIPDSEIEKLLDCERNGQLYVEQTTALQLQKNEIAQIVKVTNQIAELESQLEVFKSVYDGIKDSLKAKMIEYGVKSYEDDNLKITYVEPYTRDTLDSKRLQAEMPELYHKYKKTSTVKDSVKITVRSK
jgi:hypothetical protein